MGRVKPKTKTGGVAFEDRLFYTLVALTLKAMESELVGVKSARFLCDHRWTPGKRLRPISFLLTNGCARLQRSNNVEFGRREARLAAAIELMHEASLIHDDLVDRSEQRRGQPTVQMANGHGLALLIGDYLLFRGLKLVLDAAESTDDIKLAQDLANTGLNIAHGEAEQLHRYLNGDSWEDRVSMDNYLGIIAKKTASFFAGCTEAGAALAGADPTARANYRELGMNMGMVFQMMDDLIDAMGDPRSARKSLRNNLAEGTVTLPMIHATALYADRRVIRDLASGKELDTRGQAAFYRLLQTTSVLDQTRATIQEYAQRARKYIRTFPVNIYRAGLEDLIEFVESCPWGGFSRSAMTAMNI